MTPRSYENRSGVGRDADSSSSRSGDSSQTTAAAIIWRPKLILLKWHSAPSSLLPVIHYSRSQALLFHNEEKTVSNYTILNRYLCTARHKQPPTNAFWQRLGPCLIFQAETFFSAWLSRKLIIIFQSGENFHLRWLGRWFEAWYVGSQLKLGTSNIFGSVSFQKQHPLLSQKLPWRLRSWWFWKQSIP